MLNVDKCRTRFLMFFGGSYCAAQQIRLREAYDKNMSRAYQFKLGWKTWAVK
jgi:hypothetical protein